VTADATQSTPLVLVVEGSGGDRPPGVPPEPSPARFAFAAGLSDVRRLLPEADVALLWDFRSGVLRDAWPAANRLRWVHIAGAGVDATMFPELVAGDIVLTNARGVFDHGMAEYALALLLAWAKDVPRTLALQAERVWQHRRTDTLDGKRLVVVGPGSIGRAVARLAASFGMHVSAVGRRAREDDPDFERVHGGGDLRRALADADYIVLTVPLTPSSRELIGPDEIAAMAPTARLVNLARGGVIDEDALIEALAEGRIAGAALDVFRDEPLDRASPLWRMPNVIVSPHMSGDLLGYQEALARQFLDNLDRWVSGRPLRNVVDKRLGFVPSEAGTPSARRPDAGRPGT